MLVYRDHTELLPGTADISTCTIIAHHYDQTRAYEAELFITSRTLVDFYYLRMGSLLEMQKFLSKLASAIRQAMACLADPGDTAKSFSATLRSEGPVKEILFVQKSISSFDAVSIKKVAARAGSYVPDKHIVTLSAVPASQTQEQQRLATLAKLTRLLEAMNRLGKAAKAEFAGCKSN